MNAQQPADAMSWNDYLESEEFYNLMQAYRHSGVVNEFSVVQAYEAVKNFIRRHEATEFDELRERNVMLETANQLNKETIAAMQSAK